MYTKNISILLLAFFYSVFSLAEELRIATWNMGAPEAEAVVANQENLTKANNAIAADILIVQEVTHLNQLIEIAEMMGYINPDIAISDFSTFNSFKYFALEVGIISNIPITSVTEFQAETQNKLYAGPPLAISGEGKAIKITENIFKHQEIKDEDISSLVKTDLPVGGRGFLRIVLEDNLVVYPVHFKSSGLNACREIHSPVIAAHDLLVEIEGTKKGGDEWLSDDHAVKMYLEQANTIFTDFIQNQSDIEKILINETRDSARKREYLANKILQVISKKDDLKSQTIIVAGDMNTPWHEDCVTGKDVMEDTKFISGIRCSIPYVLSEEVMLDVEEMSCDKRDGFDDTHAIMSGHNTHGISLLPLTDTLNHRTYVQEGRFVDSPIDHIYVGGKNSGSFSDAFIPKLALKSVSSIDFPRKRGLWWTDDQKKGKKQTIWGSDHFPVVTKLKIK